MSGIDNRVDLLGTIKESETEAIAYCKEEGYSTYRIIEIRVGDLKKVPIEKQKTTDKIEW